MALRLEAARMRLLLSCTLLVGACSNGGSYDESLDAPTDVFANPAVTAADVGWTAVEGAARYRITARARGQPDVQSEQPATATGVRLSGLAADTDYRVTVVAVDEAGDASPQSDEATVHVPRLLNTVQETTRFNSAASYSESHDGEAVLVLRDGQVVFQRYANRFNRNNAHALASGSKSFSCAFMLAAEQDGLVRRNQRVADRLTEWQGDPNKSRITVLDLLSLQSGLSTNPNYNPALVSNLDTYALALEDPANYSPGQAFIYDPLAFQAFALMFERASNNTDPVAYLQDKVFEPIGLAGDTWQRDAQGHPQMAGGATMTAGAWALYGQLMLQNGSWETRRVLPASGVRDCLTYQNPAYLGYGITWWLNRPVDGTYDPNIDKIPVDGIAGSSGKIAPRAPADMVMAAGVGHQRLYLLPTQRLVVVRFAPLDTEFDEWSDDEFLGRLLGS
ncbi:serine hydrolase [Hydrocarboniphaga effusa]|jgi:CubicO group peptidase (beta-lactamase class C family)|uniref:serine hydrolase n=1 Tax=Hydrocarboniphaga effusa TaxID=243629 RepID=UPI0031379B40